MKLFENDYSKINHLAESKTLVQVWKKFCMPEDFRITQIKTVELFKAKKCVNLISDTTNAGVLRKEETEWAAQTITPQLIEAGLKEINFVVPNNVFTQMTLKNLHKQEQGSLPLNYFPNVNDALNHVNVE